MKGRAVAVAFLALVLSLSLMVPAYADHGKDSKGQCKGMGDKISYKAGIMLKNKEELGLSDKQVAQIKDLKHQAKRDAIMQKAEIDVLGLDIKAKLHEDPIDTDAVNKLVDKKYDLKKAKTKAMIADCAKLQSILTDKQKADLKALWKKCKKSDGGKRNKAGKARKH
ncbi:MAG: Spy/CpxP family protein refolding chaperone [Candidatus Omnitrophica bacterium]|nr:Spy/CpxP family protein refolding chaperone [Candidatus Omnitrophota bacterium]